MSKSYIFPVFENYSNVLNVGSTNVSPKYVDEVLVLQDVTGSMGDYLNPNRSEGSKWSVAKKILKKLENRGFKITVLPFNTHPLDLCSVDNIPEPGGSTYFSPLVPRVREIFKSGKHNFQAVIFASDGLPTENQNIARAAIIELGMIVRENHCNPVSLAIGNDADGSACALFSGNRGYECFIRYLSQLDTVVNDICNGLTCNYHMLPNGDFIPIENDGNYYYVSKNVDGLIYKPDYNMIFKFLNIAMLDEFSKEHTDYYKLNRFIKFIAEIEKDDVKRNELIAHFTLIVGDVHHRSAEQDGTPSLMSAKKAYYRESSGGQA
jgi:hypothetical protein